MRPIALGMSAAAATDCPAVFGVPGKGGSRMLILSRKTDEVVMIGDDIRLVIVDIRDGRVRLGIDAPPEVPVHRLEIYQAIKREEGGDGAAD
jgi:carbon storage regulator